MVAIHARGAGSLAKILETMCDIKIGYIYIFIVDIFCKKHTNNVRGLNNEICLHVTWHHI